MIIDRLHTLMNRLSDRTVFAELLAPVEQVLTRVREAQDVGRVLSLSAFITLGVLRQLQGMATLREQVQALYHLDLRDAAHVPLARSTWSDARAAPTRAAALAATVPVLVADARAVLPDRLCNIPGLGERPDRAVDGTYQAESAHFRRRTPKDGGADNPKGHARLSFFNVRLGIGEAVHVETRSRHEAALLRDYDQGAQALTRERQVLWLLDDSRVAGDQCGRG